MEKIKDILGIRAKKINSNPGDGHQDGANCVIIAESTDTSTHIVYLALFNDFPLPVGIVDFRVKLLTNEKRRLVKLDKTQQAYIATLPKNMFKFYYDEQGKEEQEKAENSTKN